VEDVTIEVCDYWQGVHWWKMQQWRCTAISKESSTNVIVTAEMGMGENSAVRPGHEVYT